MAKTFLYAVAAFLSLILFINTSYAYEDCSSEVYQELKEKLENIKISYDYEQDLELDDINYDFMYVVKVEGLPEGFYIYSENDEISSISSSNNEGYVKESGVYKLEVRSSQCYEVIDELKIEVPEINKHALSDECEGIDINSNPECNPWKNSVEKEEVNSNSSNKEEINSDSQKDNNEEKNENIKIENVNSIIDYFKENYLWIISVAVIFVIVIIIIATKKKNRGVLD